jgi:hypothetical protein
MNVFNALQKTMADELNGNAYFTQIPPCPVYWQGQKEGENKKPLETAKAMQTALNGLSGFGGAAVMVLHPKIQRAGDLARANVPILFLENVTKNRSSDGTQKTAFDFATKALAILTGATEDAFAPWSQVLLEDLDDNVEVEHEGIEGWVLTVSCTTLLDIFNSVIGDPNAGFFLVTENNQPLAVEPTEA